MNTIVTNYGEFRLKPLHDRILVRRMDEPSQHLIQIPDIAKEQTKIGEVIAAGPCAFGIKEGDVILLPGIAAKYPDWERAELIMIELGDVAGVFEVNEA